MYNTLVSLLLGFWYGCSFMYQHKGAFERSFFVTTLFSCFRIIITLLCARYLLRIEDTNLILVIASFVCGFIGTIFIARKVTWYAWP